MSRVDIAVPVDHAGALGAAAGQSTEGRAPAGFRKPADARRFVGGGISVAFVAGLVLVPVVIATGLLTDDSASGGAPADVAVTALRGTLGGVGSKPSPAIDALNRDR